MGFVQRTPHMKLLAGMPGPMSALFFLIIATALEVSGDALIRKSLFEHAGLARLGLLLLGAALVTGYGTFLNLAPLEFGQVVGLYIATLFVMWQIINFLFFRDLPTLPILAGGVLIVTGGLIVSFWKSAA
jgi:drug/metabolite transporter (DMT)-like permease